MEQIIVVLGMKCAYQGNALLFSNAQRLMARYKRGVAMNNVEFYS